MHQPETPQPASHLISRALAEAGIYTKLRRPAGSYNLVAVNDCNDDRTYWDKLAQIEEVLNRDLPEGQPTCGALPLPFFGGIVGISPDCPGYDREFARFMINHFRLAALKRGIRKFFAGAHGEVCGFCGDYGITVAQRQWLSRDAKMIIMRTAEVEQWTMPSDPIQICVTWHRRYLKGGNEHQKTRVIGVRHPLFEELPAAAVMRMTDEQVLERLAPHLLDLVAVS